MWDFCVFWSVLYIERNVSATLMPAHIAFFLHPVSRLNKTDLFSCPLLLYVKVSLKINGIQNLVNFESTTCLRQVKY